jgi:hypothetical protein
MRYLLTFLFILSFKYSYSQAVTEQENFIINPQIGVGNTLSMVKEYIKGSGFTYQDGITSNDIKYIRVKTKKYNVFYYYNDKDIVKGVRIFDDLKKMKKWQDYYQKNVKKWPNLWTKTDDFNFKMKATDSNAFYINLLQDFENDLVLINIE